MGPVAESPTVSSVISAQTLIVKRIPIEVVNAAARRMASSATLANKTANVDRTNLIAVSRMQVPVDNVQTNQ